MSTLTNTWWRVASLAAAGVLTIPALTLPVLAGPAAAAPSDGSVVAEALELRAALAQLTRGQRGSATGVDDGMPGGAWIAAGENFSCSAGMIKTYCWGAGDAGQLGAGDTADALDPVEVETSDELDEDLVGAIAAGAAHTCALSWFDEEDDGGDLYCWGDNADGQVGDGSTTGRSEPVQVGEDIRQVATGAHHTCAITEDAGVTCWGRNDQGQLGLGGTGTPELEPKAVPGLADVIDVAAGGDTTCALDEDGKAWCWGSDGDGQLGDGSGAGSGSGTPVAVVMSDVDDDFAQIEVGAAHVCAVTDEGDVWCWGDDTSGQLGDGAATADTSQPVEAVNDEKAVSISAGGDSTCAVARSATLYCWGANGQGQLGTGDRTDSEVPAEVDRSKVAGSPFGTLTEGNATAAAAAPGYLIEVSVGETHTCALDLQGNAYCWGDNTGGQIGNGTTDDALVPVATSLMPGPVTGVRATPGDGELVVSWRPPADLGSSELLGFFSVAVEKEGGFGDGFCKGTNGCVIGDLTNGVTYQVVVVTQTEGGLSLSDAVSGVPAGRASPAPAPGGGGGGHLPITGAAVSLLIVVGGALVAGGALCVRLVRRRAS